MEAVKTVKNMTAGNIMALVHSDMSYTLDSLKSIETDGNEEKTYRVTENILNHTVNLWK